MTDWATIASLATAGGTLVLAVATFSSVRSTARAARATERALLASIRPVVVPSRPEDPPERVGFIDNHWYEVPGGGAVADATDGAVYLVIALRNVGNGLAVLDRWFFSADDELRMQAPAAVSQFRRLTRDLYVPADGIGFWQGALREAGDPWLAEARQAIADRHAMWVDLLYGDHEGGQRTISRIGVIPAQDGDGWIAAIGRHWNLDRDEPR